MRTSHNFDVWYVYYWDGKWEWHVWCWYQNNLFVNIFENTDQFLKIQTKYRPIFDIFLKRSVLQTKIIFTDHCVITAIFQAKSYPLHEMPQYLKFLHAILQAMSDLLHEIPQYLKISLLKSSSKVRVYPIQNIGWITDYARLVLKDQRNRNRSIEHRFN